MKKKHPTKARLELDTELIADLDTDGGAVKGGLSGSRPPRSLGGSASVGTVGIVAVEDGGLQAGC